jgi:G:T-mismatch repair DNA endonuclease (very short patch repair protein)
MAAGSGEEGIYEYRTSGSSFSSIPDSNELSRDLEMNRLLRKTGWRVIRVWECDLTRANAPCVVRRIQKALGG